TLEIHLGSTSGPLLATADVRVCSPLRIAVTPHFVRIDTTSTVGTRPNLDLDVVFRRVQAIWNPCGVHFHMGAHVNDNTTLTSNILNTCDLTVDADITTLLGLQRARLNIAAGTNDQSLNMYVIQTMRNPNF